MIKLYNLYETWLSAIDIADYFLYNDIVYIYVTAKCAADITVSDFIGKCAIKYISDILSDFTSAEYTSLTADHTGDRLLCLFVLSCTVYVLICRV